MARIVKYLTVEKKMRISKKKTKQNNYDKWSCLELAYLIHVSRNQYYGYFRVYL